MCLPFVETFTEQHLHTAVSEKAYSDSCLLNRMQFVASTYDSFRIEIIFFITSPPSVAIVRFPPRYTSLQAYSLYLDNITDTRRTPRGSMALAATVQNEKCR